MARTGARVTLVDAATDDFHASAANFGLVWVQGKGLGAPDYAALSLRAAQAWDGFAADLAQGSGVSPAYRRSGGLRIALSEAELDRTRANLARLHNQPGGAQDTRIIDRDALRAMLPGIGPDAVGAAYCPHDGHADPLRTLRRCAPCSRHDHRADAGDTGAPAEIRLRDRGPRWPDHGRPRRARRRARERESRAGSGPARAAAPAARADPDHRAFAADARHRVRQTADGTVMLGDSKEDAGFDRGTTQDVAHKIAARARSFPAPRARLVRSWAGLRVMSPDGLPIYQARPPIPAPIS